MHAAPILAGDLRALARTATFIENRPREAEPLLRELFPHIGRARMIGITGAPGAGKSTLVDHMIRLLRDEGRRVGVIAVDPSSPWSGGAILGDRVRMQRHHDDAGVFVRSMATRGCLGGLARATTDMTVLLDAAGFDTILIETVGVGQDEVEIARVADATLVLLVPGLGDDVQALKAGIMEIADVFVLNKADLDGADRLEQEVRAAVSLAARADGWSPAVVRAVASEGRGIADVLTAAREYLARGGRERRTAENWAARLREMLRERVLDRFGDVDFAAAGTDVAAGRRDPWALVEEWLNDAR
ncbi:MAG TPA: methylmalonyl Co-A mutase-associated GTPase MeaB [Bryobacteraceae bacterium]|nr:methylmalonyl Co-A mutase-associated GTPase MeaB [Bryobacteraceae bacterium]